MRPLLVDLDALTSEMNPGLPTAMWMLKLGDVIMLPKKYKNLSVVTYLDH